MIFLRQVLDRYHNSEGGGKQKMDDARDRFKKAAAFIITICIFAIFSNIVHAESVHTQRETVRVGFFAMDGYHMMDEEGSRSGYGWDVLRLMARYWDVDYEYVGYENSWEDMLQMLENGEIDMVSSARKVTEREDSFDFSYAIGDSDGILTVRRDNKKIIAQDYSTYNGMRVALLNGNTRNEDFHVLSEEKGFTYVPIYFDMTSDMEDALQSGQVDAIVTSSLRQIKNERVLERFNSSEFYIMVKKGNTALLDKVNKSIEQMNNAESDWKTELKNKYYEHSDDKMLDFTEDEKAVIQEYSSEENALLVLCDPTRYPYSYNEDGEIKGIIPDYFKKIAEYSGISYKFIDCKTRNDYINYQTDPTVSLYIDARISDENWTESRNLAITAPYITMRIAMVTRTDFLGEIDTLATVNQTSAGSIEDLYAKDAEKIVYENRDEAMQAVLDGKADAAFVYYYSAQSFVSSERSGMLTYTLLEDTLFQYRMIVSANINHALAGILTKSIYAMPEHLIEELAYQYTAYKVSDITLMSMIQLHPRLFMTAAAVMVCFLITGIVLAAKMRFRRQMQEMAQQKADEMAILAQEAQMANIAKSTFLAHISHDIRTPMNAIIGYTDIALKGEIPHELRNYLNKIKESTSHLLSLISDVLDLTRIESGKDIYCLEPTDLSKVTDTVINIGKGLIYDRDLTFEVQGPTEEAPLVLADSVRIREVLVNILSNAVKFTKNGGRIIFSITYSPHEDENHIKVCYKISDTGVGMSEEFVTHAFDEFAQENSNVRTEYQGSGLGLAIVKRYVTMMGGTISLKSKIAEGSTFTVEIPLELVSETHAEKDTASEDSVNLQGVKVLLAEDNDLNAEIAIDLLEDAGMKVTRAINGKDVIELYKNHLPETYDIILMDIMMPEMDGYEATKAIRSMEDRPDGKNIPIIAVTAKAFSEDVQKSIDAGMNGHLSKPISIDEIIKVISKHIKTVNSDRARSL